jgi:hypothetical protein
MAVTRTELHACANNYIIFRREFLLLSFGYGRWNFTQKQSATANHLMQTMDFRIFELQKAGHDTTAKILYYLFFCFAFFENVKRK